MATSSDTNEALSGWQILAPHIDLVTPMAVRVAATLRLADLIGDEPTPVTVLAAESGTDQGALLRLLRHLVSHGIFAEPGRGEFVITDKARLLRSDDPSGMRVSLDLSGFGGQMDLAFTELLHTVRTGKPAWERMFGAPFWQYLSDNPHMAASFDAVMSAGAEYVADDATAYDWSNARHVVDVGGGNGALVAALLSEHPQLSATLIDLPDTVERARPQLAAHGFGERLRLVGQSFFDPLPTGGDIYVLNSVLHDWPDSEARAILRRCADAAGPTGTVLIIDNAAPDDAPPRQNHTEMDLRMLVLCGGQERTVDQFTRLADGAGLAVTEVRHTRLGQTGIACVAR